MNSKKDVIENPSIEQAKSLAETPFELKEWCDYNRKIVHEEQIIPLIEQIKDKCLTLGIPMYMCFQTAYNDEDIQTDQHLVAPPNIALGSTIIALMIAPDYSTSMVYHPGYVALVERTRIQLKQDLIKPSEMN